MARGTSHPSKAPRPAAWRRSATASNRNQLVELRSRDLRTSDVFCHIGATETDVNCIVALEQIADGDARYCRRADPTEEVGEVILGYQVQSLAGSLVDVNGFSAVTLTGHPDDDLDTIWHLLERRRGVDPVSWREGIWTSSGLTHAPLKVVG